MPWLTEIWNELNWFYLIPVGYIGFVIFMLSRGVLGDDGWGD